MTDPNPVVASTAPVPPVPPEIVSTPRPAAAGVAAPEVYRPLSLWAVAGLCLGVACCALVVVPNLVALIKAAPPFLPSWPVVCLAVGGAAMSTVGLAHIALAEGTRAGGTLARWGLWLSIVPGLAFTAYSMATGGALIEQARRFLDEADDPDSGFFVRLQEANPRAPAHAGKSEDEARRDAETQLNRAFLLCLPVSRRTGYDPANTEQIVKDFDQVGARGDQGALPQFHAHLLVQALKQGAAKTVIEPVGRAGWQVEQGGYLVTLKYRIETPEQTFDVLVPVQSDEESADGRRRWFVVLPRAKTSPPQLTPLGESMQKVRNASRGLLKNIRPPRIRDKTDYAKILPNPFEQWFFSQKLEALFAGNDPELWAGLQPPGESLSSWQILENGRLQFTHELEWNLKLRMPPVWVRARFRYVMETVGPYEAEAADLHWEGVSFEVTRAQVIRVQTGKE